MDWNKLPLDPRHPGVPSGVPKMVSMPMLYLAQTVHLSCAQINIISKWIETIYHLTHAT
jgi:hypothetical protein